MYVMSTFTSLEAADFSTTFGSFPATVSFEANPDNVNMTYELMPVQDSVAEPTECLLLSLAETDGLVTLSQPSTLTICIEDDDSE